MNQAVHNAFSPIFAGAMTRFRGKWIDGEIFGKENSESNGRYCLFSGECDDPFDAGLEGRLRVIARLVGERYRTFCGLDFHPRGEGATADVLPRKSVRLTGWWDDLVVLRMAVDSLLLPGPVLRSGSEPAFWMSGLADGPELEARSPIPPSCKVYRRRPGDMRERATRFAGTWLELEASLRLREKTVPATHAAYAIRDSRGSLSGEVFIECLHEGNCHLRVQVVAGDSSLGFLRHFSEFGVARQAGLEWAGLLGGMVARAVEN